ncbi:MAG: porin family protein, partial [Deltaproteobacteria bacterium]|nr:porin family protein [Deltaproteobacteria bacterium]
LISAKPSLTRAEYLMDLYLGAAMTDDSEVQVDTYFPRESASERTSYDTSFTFGYRFGYWLDFFHYLGFAADLSYFEAESEKVDFSIVPFSILFMLRWPLLTSAEYPHGKIQPYLGGGPSLIYYDMSVDLRPTVSEKVSDWSFEDGWDFRAGLLWQFHTNFGIFGEYRYTHYKINYKDETEEWILGFEPRTRLKVETTLETHHFLTGIAFRF